jgi:hypothetical protein
VLVSSQTVSWDLVAGQLPDATVAQQIKPLTVNSTGSCSLTLKYDIAGTLSGLLTCTGLTSPVTAAHIHCLATTTDLVNGDFPVAYDTGINDTQTSPYTFTNLLDVTNAGLLCSDKCYFNVHTRNNSGGEVRLNLVGFTGVCGTGKVFSGTGSIGTDLLTYGVAPAGQMPSWTIQTVYGATGGCSAWVSYTTGAPGSLTVAGSCKTLTGTKITGVYVHYNGTALTDINFIPTGTIGSTVPYSYTKSWTDAQRDELCNTKGETVDTKKFSVVIETDTSPLGEATGVLTLTTACPSVTAPPTVPPTTPAAPNSGFTYSVTILLLVFSTLTSFFW